MKSFVYRSNPKLVLTCLSLTVILSMVTVGTYLSGHHRTVPIREGTARPQSRPRRALLGTPLVFSNGNNTLTYDSDEAECSQLNTLKDNQDKCLFVKAVDSCRLDGLINYLQFIYCQVPSKLLPLAMTLLCLWLLYLFIVLGATAQEFFCPSLQIISETLRLSQNVAGVTFLAFGNGAPDIFSGIAVIRQPDGRKASLAIGALFGAGMFVGSVVVGFVSITKPFRLTERPFLRDILFYLVAVFWTFVILWQNKVTIYSAVGFLIMYALYVSLVIFGRLTFQNWRNWRKRRAVQSDPEGIQLEPLTPPTTEILVGESEASASVWLSAEQSNSPVPIVPMVEEPSPHHLGQEHVDGLGPLVLESVVAEQAGLGTADPSICTGPSEGLLDELASPVGDARQQVQVTIADLHVHGSAAEATQASPRSFTGVLETLWPNGPDLRNLSMVGRICDIIKNPAGFLFTFTLPVVDADEEESGEEWNIWLNALRVLTVLGLFMSVTRSSKRALPVGSQGEPTCRGTPPTSILISEEGIGLPDVESVEHPMPPSVEELQRPESGTALRPVAKSHCVVGEPLLSNDASVATSVVGQSEHKVDHSQHRIESSQYRDNLSAQKSEHDQYEHGDDQTQHSDDQTQHSNDQFQHKDDESQLQGGKSQHRRMGHPSQHNNDRSQYKDWSQSSSGEHSGMKVHVLVPELKIAGPRIDMLHLTTPRRREAGVRVHIPRPESGTQGTEFRVSLTQSMVRNFILVALNILNGWTAAACNSRRHRMRLAIAGALSNDSSNDRPLAFGSLPIKSNVLSVASPHAPPTGLDSEVDGAASTSVQGLSDDHSMSAATTSKRTAKIRPDKLPKLTPQRSFEHGRFEEGKPKSQSFRAPAESPRPVTESMLYNLVAAAAFPAAPADKVLDVLANTPVADSRRHQVLGGPQSNSDGVEQTITPDTVPTEETAQNEILPHQAPPSSNSANEQSQVEDGLAFATTCIKRWLPNPFVKLLQDLWPFGQDFKDLGIGGKIYEIVKSPAGFFITLTVPVVDHDKPNDNWNKWLSVLHCVTAPLFFILVTQLGFYNIGGVFPIWTLVLIISTILAMVVAHTSKEDSKPIYHWVFAYVGFLVSVIWIYSVANEIVDILQTFGAAFNVSDGILGLTFLAWGNSIGDAVSNMTMARQGFPQMAVGACIGSPLFNILIAIGIGSIIKMASSGVLEFPIYFSQVELVAAGFLMFSLSCTALVVSCLCFRLTRYYGALLIILYIIFLVTSILAEAGILHISITGVLTR